MSNDQRSSGSRTIARKLPPQAVPYAFAFFMAGIMAFLMCCTVVAANTGIDAGYPLRVLKSYQLAMPVAFFGVLVVRPIVVRLVGFVCHPH
ncbi:DUF2798 domain-containing protein [Sinorhizobium sp. BG8]|uniref:DUF2798 domain-containing protein n=1 Tax=Sinorhizobium sp. BG8 TaxID=2613773 RepID=UPI00193E3730|nr:DUF2798 domain-containing protein [Sinorhizobium sp. BG8]QRM54682.1 DUF2798 domain-containing protein [Sinorhizobium sp. BG8]